MAFRRRTTRSVTGLSRLCTFLRWCVRHGEADPALVEVLAGRDNPLRQIPRLYGKVQGVMPARWLSHEEAFERLVGACRDGTDLDEVKRGDGDGLR